MDHLPYPPNAVEPGLEVPFLCSNDIAGGRTLEALCSMPIETLWAEHMKDAASQNDSLRFAALVQAGIFFRPFKFLFGDLFDTRYLTLGRTTKKKEIVTLRKLLLLMNIRKTKSYLRRDLDLLGDDLAQDFHFSLIIDIAHKLNHLDSPCPEVGLSILALIWTVSPRFIRYLRWRPAQLGGDFLQQRMLTAGWCPYWTKVYSEKFSPFLQYYLSGLPQHQYVHTNCERDVPCPAYDVKYKAYRPRHASDCRGSTCNFRGSTCNFRGSTCNFRGPNTEKLRSIITKGDLPLIRLSRRSDRDPVELELVEYNCDTPFIALSHVWSGGLGHFKANTLPQCQIEFLYRKLNDFKFKRAIDESLTYVKEYSARLTEYCSGLNDPLEDTLLKTLMSKHLHEKSGGRYCHWKSSEIEYYPRWEGVSRCLLNLATPHYKRTLDNLYAGVYIWLDTLCIPSDPSIVGLEQLKQKSINKMPLIYSMATHVLIIDQLVEQLSVSEPPLVLAASFVTCPWMTRCWTFQEGCLARKMVFLCRDGFVAPDELARKHRVAQADSGDWTLEGILVDECCRYFLEMTSLGDANSGKDQSGNSFIQIWNEIAIRKTSIPEDLHGLLAVLLRFSMHEVFFDERGQKRTPSQRMLAILKGLPSLPVSILFVEYASGVKACNDVPWLPRFPAGYLPPHKEHMTWKDDSSAICLPDFGNVQYLIKTGGQPLALREGSFALCYLQQPLDAGNETEPMKTILSVKLLAKRNQQLVACSESATFAFIIDCESNQGACLLVQKYAEGMSPLMMDFICPLRYEAIGEQVTSLIQHEVTTVSDPEIELLLNTGPNAWPQTRYRRPNPKEMQHSISPALGIFALLYWILYGIFVYNSLRVHPYEQDPKLIDTLPRILKLLARIPFPKYLTDKIRSPWRIAIILKSLLTRMLMFLGQEILMLELNMDRARQERFAWSLEHADRQPRPHRLRQEPSYQFDRGWLVILSFVFSVGFNQWQLVKDAGADGPVRAHKHRLNLYGVIGEMLLSVIFEVVWRYFKMDLP